MELIPKPGQIVTDGKAINIGAPVIQAAVQRPDGPPSDSELVGTILRHLKGVLASAEELRIRLEQREKGL